MTEKIDQFDGEHRFLSNFYPCKVNCYGDIYPSVEHAFQAAKSLEPSQRRKICKAATPGQAKRLGRTVTLRSDWEKVKVDIMLNLLRQKFSDPELQTKLIATGDSTLIEGNTWGDRFWGAVNGQGTNMLGTLLTIVRLECRKGMIQ